MDLDYEQLGAEIAMLLDEGIAKATAPLLERIAQLEARQMPEAIKGDDGESVDMAAVTAQVAEYLATIPKPEDGKSVTVADLEPVLRGMSDSWALDFERRAQGVLERAAGRIPKPKDGEDGQDGQDGLGFDDMTVEHNGRRSFTLKFQQGDRVKSFEFTLPLVLDAGFYQEGKAYEAGDGVTFGGSYWIAKADTTDKPAVGSESWRLAVKKGRDGKVS